MFVRSDALRDAWRAENENDSNRHSADDGKKGLLFRAVRQSFHFSRNKKGPKASPFRWSFLVANTGNLDLTGGLWCYDQSK